MYVIPPHGEYSKYSRFLYFNPRAQPLTKRPNEGCMKMESRCVTGTMTKPHPLDSINRMNQSIVIANGVHQRHQVLIQIVRNKFCDVYDVISLLRRLFPSHFPHLKLRLLVHPHRLRKTHGPEFMKIPLVRIKLPGPSHRLLTAAKFIQAQVFAVRFSSRMGERYGDAS